MAIIALNAATNIPVGHIRAQLSAHVPGYRWLCGEDDTGGDKDVADSDRACLIMGTNDEGRIFLEISPLRGPSSGTGIAPAHKHHLEISEPTVDDRVLADRILVVLCAAMAVGRDPPCFVQLAPGSLWLDSDQMDDALQSLLLGQTAEALFGFDRSIASVGEVEPANSDAVEIVPEVQAVRPAELRELILASFGPHAPEPVHAELADEPDAPAVRHEPEPVQSHGPEPQTGADSVQPPEPNLVEATHALAEPAADPDPQPAPKVIAKPVPYVGARGWPMPAQLVHYFASVATRPLFAMQPMPPRGTTTRVLGDAVERGEQHHGLASLASLDLRPANVSETTLATEACAPTEAAPPAVRPAIPVAYEPDHAEAARPYQVEQRLTVVEATAPANPLPLQAAEHVSAEPEAVPDPAEPAANGDAIGVIPDSLWPKPGDDVLELDAQRRRKEQHDGDFFASLRASARSSVSPSPSWPRSFEPATDHRPQAADLPVQEAGQVFAQVLAATPTPETDPWYPAAYPPSPAEIAEQQRAAERAQLPVLTPRSAAGFGRKSG